MKPPSRHLARRVHELLNWLQGYLGRSFGIEAEVEKACGLLARLTVGIRAGEATKVCAITLAHAGHKERHGVLLRLRGLLTASD